MTLACIITAHDARKHNVMDRVLPSVLAQDFDEIVLVGNWEWRFGALPERTRYLHIGSVFDSPRDALLKRDAGTLATTADTLVYLCDDHVLQPGFGDGLRAVLDEPWDVLVPNRVTKRIVGQRPTGARQDIIETVVLNNGEREKYCGGHCGVYRRALVERRPWISYAHSPMWYNWDLWVGLFQRAVDNARFVWEPRADITIEDIEPEREPWR